MPLCDTGSSQTCVDSVLLEKLNLDEEEVKIRVSGFHGTPQIQGKKVETTLVPAKRTVANRCTILVKSQKSLAGWKEKYDLRPLKRK